MSITADAVKIFATGFELFKKFGIKAVTMEQISNACGISKKTLYKFVSNKPDFLFQSFSFFAQGMEAVLYEVLEKNGGNAIDDLFAIERFAEKHSVQTALVAAVSLSAETTDEGRIEVSLWSEEVDGFNCMNLRIIDTGVGWGLPEDDQPSEPFDNLPTETLEPESSVARRALRACLRHSGTRLILTDESDEQNEYHLTLWNGRAHDDFGWASSLIEFP